MSRTVLVMRHGESRWNDFAVTDHDRKLTSHGKHDACRMGEGLRAHGLVPDVIVSSTARRARSTARWVAKTCGFEGKVRLHAGFYFGGIEPAIEVLTTLDPTVQCVLLVGHNPIVEALVFHLTGNAVIMPTAALARIELAVGAWAEVDGSVAGELCFLITPWELAEPPEIIAT